MKALTLVGAFFAVGATMLAQAPSNPSPKYLPGLDAMITTAAGVITAQLFENGSARDGKCSEVPIYMR